MRKIAVPREVGSGLLNADAELKQIAVRNYQSGIALLDETGALQWTTPFVTDYIGAFAWSKNGVLAHNSGASLHLWDLNTGTLRASPPILGQMSELWFNGDNLQAIVSRREDDETRSEIWNWNAQSALLNSTRILTRGGSGWVVSPGRRWAAATGRYMDETPIYELKTGKIKRTIKFEGQGMSVGFADERFVAAIDRDERLRIWDLWNGSHRLVHTNTEDNDFEALFLAVSPNARFVAGAGYEGVRLWEIGAQTQSKHEWNLGNGSSDAVTFSPDGKWLATSDDEGNPTVWEMPRQAGQKPRQWKLEGRGAGVTNAIFSSDGRFLVASASDGTLSIYETARFSQGKTALRVTLTLLPEAQWLALAPDGAFEASPEAGRYLRWRPLKADVSQPLLPFDSQNERRRTSLLRLDGKP